MYSALHAEGYKSKAAVSAILPEDSFSNNDTDLTSGNVQQVDYEGNFAGLSEAGNYRIIVSGNIKGNSGAVAFNFSISSNSIVIGGCDCSQ